MRSTVFVALLTLATSAAPAIGQGHLWSQRFGDVSEDGGIAVAVDNSGHVVVTGSFQGEVDFGGGPLTSAGSDDIFVAKFDSNGNHIWSRRLGDTERETGLGIAVDEVGNVIVTGWFEGTVDFGGGPLASAGAWDIYVAKFDAGGNHIWSRRSGDTELDTGYGIAVDKAGNVIVTGSFRGTVDFGGGPLTSVGFGDIFVAKYDAVGNHLWSARYGDFADDHGFAMTADEAGDILVTGTFNGTMNLGGGSLSSDGWDGFVAKYDTAGTHVWSLRFGGDIGSSDRGSSIAVDGAGNVLVTGYFTATDQQGLRDREVFITKYDRDGNMDWSLRFDNGPFDEMVATGVAVDLDTNVYITGNFWYAVDFGGGPLTSNGRNDIFVASYDANGAHLWSQSFGDTDWDSGRGLASDAGGNLIVTGFLRGVVDFGGGPLTSAGGGDIFLAKFGGNTTAVAISSFDARAFEGGVALLSSFSSDLRVLGVNVYRAEASSPLLLHESVPHSGNEFYYEDHNVEPGHTYRYRIGVVDADGEFFSPIATVRIKSYETVLLPNAPNPFNPSTTIRFTLEKTIHVTLSIYDAHGKQVTTLVDDVRGAGPHEVQWDGTDTAGSSVSSGVYFYRMKAGKTSQSRRMALLK